MSESYVGGKIPFDPSIIIFDMNTEKKIMRKMSNQNLVQTRITKLNRRVRRASGLLLTAGMLFLAGCGSEGGRNVNSKNVVESAINGQIAAQDQKTAAVTETVTETPATSEQSTSQASASQTSTQASTSELDRLIGTTEAVTEPVTEAATKAERSSESDKQLMDEIKASYTDTPDASVDIDLTVMDSDMVYATVYQMVYADPDAYIGKTFKAAGTLTIASSSVTNQFYPYVVIKDALACCQQGIEFQWGDDKHTSIEDFPAEGTELEVIGTFESYKEDGDPYLYTRLKDTKIKLLAEEPQQMNQ